jgi:hypothetical protein
MEYRREYFLDWVQYVAVSAILLALSGLVAAIVAAAVLEEVTIINAVGAIPFIYVSSGILGFILGGLVFAAVCLLRWVRR